MKNQILDEDFRQEKPKKEVKNIMLDALTAVLIMAFLYAFIFTVFIDDVEYSNVVMEAIVEDSVSILHLLMAMAYLNHGTIKGDYKPNVKGGYYILLFGSGIFFIGASISIIEYSIGWIENGRTHSFWNANYQHIITLAVIFVKFLLIRPIALLLNKLTKNVSTKK